VDGGNAGGGIIGGATRVFRGGPELGEAITKTTILGYTSIQQGAVHQVTMLMTLRRTASGIGRNEIVDCERKLQNEKLIKQQHESGE